MDACIILRGIMMNMKRTGLINKIAFIIFIFIFLSTVVNVSAYENNQRSQTLGGGAHRKINQLAISKYVDEMKTGSEDEAFKLYDFEPLKPADKYMVKPLNKDVKPEEVKLLFMPAGKAVTARTDWRDASYQAAIKTMKGTFSSWVTEGGFSADEPERFMSLRHFYNPVTSLGPAYLTDIPAATGSMMMGDNPKVDAVTWATGHSDNDYSWAKGRQYLESAFSAKSLNTARESYAGAWRSLGEVMHLISDMTVPAHVRNDSHPGDWRAARIYDDLRADAYEYVTNSDLSIITNGWRNGLMDPDLLKNIKDSYDVREIFDYVATHVNTYFFSSDTIPYESALGGIATNNTWNGNGIIYSSPNLKDCTFDKSFGRYYVEDFPGEKLLMCESSWLDDDGWDDVPPKSTSTCVKSQARRLIPIAVNASSRLMELFIPKVELKVTGVEIDEKTKDPVVKGQLNVYERDGTGMFGMEPQKKFASSEQTLLLFVYVTLKGEKQKELIYLAPPAEIKGGEFDISLKDVSNEDGLYDLLHPAEGQLSKAENIQYAVGLDMGGVLVKSEIFGGDDISGTWDVESELTDVKVPGQLLKADNTTGEEQKLLNDAMKQAYGTQIIGQKFKAKMEITKASGNEYIMRSDMSSDMTEAYKAAGISSDMKFKLEGTKIISKTDYGYGQGTLEAELSSDKKTMDGKFTSTLDMSAVGAGKVEYTGKWHAVKVK